jgi:hypothetical protein
MSTKQSVITANTFEKDAEYVKEYLEQLKEFDIQLTGMETL